MYYGIGTQISEGSESDNMKVRLADPDECQHYVDVHNEVYEKRLEIVKKNVRMQFQENVEATKKGLCVHYKQGA